VGGPSQLNELAYSSDCGGVAAGPWVGAWVVGSNAPG